MKFSEKLKQAMQELNLNQRQVCGLQIYILQKVIGGWSNIYDR